MQDLSAFVASLWLLSFARIDAEENASGKAVLQVSGSLLSVTQVWLQCFDRAMAHSTGAIISNSPVALLAIPRRWPGTNSVPGWVQF